VQARMSCFCRVHLCCPPLWVGRILVAGTVLVCALLLVGCASSAATERSLGPIITLEFIEDGVTTIEQAVQRLGAPSQTIAGMAGGKMLTFWFAQEAGGLHASAGTPSFNFGRYSLVLSFDAHGVLVRHALVKVWGD
jgi:hypothetical protein